MADAWRIHGGFMADSWRIHGGFMADLWRMGLQKLITVWDMRNGHKGGGSIEFEFARGMSDKAREEYRDSYL
jgi:hypothetical protein